MINITNRFEPICDCKPFNHTLCSRKKCKCFELCQKLPLIQRYINDNLTQQNKQMREALEKIDKEFPIDDNLIFSNNLEKLCKLLFRIRDIAQQALKEVNNEK